MICIETLQEWMCVSKLLLYYLMLTISNDDYTVLLHHLMRGSRFSRHIANCVMQGSKTSRVQMQTDCAKEYDNDIV